MTSISSRLFLATFFAGAALQAGCASSEPELGSGALALDTGYSIDFNELVTGAAVGANTYAAKGVQLGLTGAPGALTGYFYNGSETLAVNTVPVFTSATILVITFHDPADATAYTTASNLGFDLSDTEASILVRSYGDTTGGQLLQTIPVNATFAHIALAGAVGRIEVEDVGGDGFVLDNLGYVLHTADAETCASRLASECPSDGPWKNHGQYVSCVSHVSQSCVDDGLATQSERSGFVTSAAQSNVGK